MGDERIMIDHANTVSLLVGTLDQAMKRLEAYVAAHGMLCDRDDEVFAKGSIALQAARGGNDPLVDAGDLFSAKLAIVPLDDEERGFSDSALPDRVVAAGMNALDRAETDMNEYVSGVTPDWDEGMIAVAVYRAMVRAARLRGFSCRHETSARDAWDKIEATDPADAARTFSHREFEESQGEWMGGVVIVSANTEASPILDTRYDVDMTFDDSEQNNLRAIVRTIREPSGDDAGRKDAES